MHRIGKGMDVVTTTTITVDANGMAVTVAATQATNTSTRTATKRQVASAWTLPRKILPPLPQPSLPAPHSNSRLPRHFRRERFPRAQHQIVQATIVLRVHLNERGRRLLVGQQRLSKRVKSRHLRHVSRAARSGLKGPRERLPLLVITSQTPHA